MNENNHGAEMNPKIKKISLISALCMLAAAVLAIFVTNAGTVTERTESTTAGENLGVGVKVTDVPDTRVYETIIVPATEYTTEKITEETTAAESTTRGAPSGYTLPLGTDMGKDYSGGVPVYNEIMADWRTHDGVDFNGAVGDGVKAVADGYIKEIRNDEFMGGTIVIDHGGSVIATYCGVEVDEKLKRGMFVEQCDRLGSLGEIPAEADAQFPHLHFEISVDGEICDPLEVMGLY